MENKYYSVRYSQLSPQALLEDVKIRYDIGEITSCKQFNFGLNDIYIVTTKEKRYFLRISVHGRVTTQEVKEEMNSIQLFSREGIKVADPVVCRDGSVCWEIEAPEGIRTAVLLQEAKNDPTGPEERRSFLFGNQVAKMHGIADKENITLSRTPIDLKGLVEIPLNQIESYFSKSEKVTSAVRGIVKQLKDFILSEIPMEAPYYGYCHGDLHTGNVFFDGENPVFFDFDCMGDGYRAYDLCVYPWNESHNFEGIWDSPKWTSFLEGYETVRPFSEAEKASLPVFAALRELWLMGLHVRLSEINCDGSWLDDEYYTYRIGRFKKFVKRAVSSEMVSRYVTIPEPFIFEQKKYEFNVKNPLDGNVRIEAWWMQPEADLKIVEVAVYQEEQILYKTEEKPLLHITNKGCGSDAEKFCEKDGYYYLLKLKEILDVAYNKEATYTVLVSGVSTQMAKIVGVYTDSDSNERICGPQMDMLSI